MFSIGKSMQERVNLNNVYQKNKFAFFACFTTLLLVLSSTTVSCMATKSQKTNPNPTHTVSRAQASSDDFHFSVQLAIDTARSALSHTTTTTTATSLAASTATSPPLPTPIDDCTELLGDTIYHLSDVLNQKKKSSSEDIKTWLSTSLTNQETCLDGLKGVKLLSHLGKELMERANNLSRIISNSLAIYTTMSGKEVKVGTGGRKLLVDGFPEWLSEGDRQLLETPVEELRPHAVVAQDGSGTHESIDEAILATSAAAGGGGRTVIHVKAGTYSEGDISKARSNVILVGDGKGVTVITGKKSAGAGYTTFSSATFGVSGDGFMARDISFVNTAGPSGEQAVALRMSSDKSVIYRCSIDGYQDSLYALSNRQFYRETDISGTVDFIFGNAAAVFQSCNIAAKGRSGDLRNTITAQGRSDKNQNTGFSIQNCQVTGSSGTPTYLGRPWKQYSRTVFLQSYLDGTVPKAGWFPWSGNFALSTLFYGEYMNTGPGSSTAGRVGWSGYHPALSATEAAEFTVAQLISGNQWLPSTGVPFDAGL